MYSITQVARILNVSRSTVLRWVHGGMLSAVKLPSGVYRIREEVLDDLLRDPVPEEVVDGTDHDC
ncbi:MAG: hypothetical protein AMS20_00160 [Gemmatimonas sp. SG8_28]|nr:MAG: hypothetical protein AMS20_00160 [Gemmatimonas sp. SG8_28]